MYVRTYVCVHVEDIPCLNYPSFDLFFPSSLCVYILNFSHYPLNPSHLLSDSDSLSLSLSPSLQVVPLSVVRLPTILCVS